MRVVTGAALGAASARGRVDGRGRRARDGYGCRRRAVSSTIMSWTLGTQTTSSSCRRRRCHRASSVSSVTMTSSTFMTSPMTVAAVVLGCAYAGERAKATRVGRALSGPVSAMALGALVANVAGQGTMAWELGEVQKLAAFLATPLLLFGADVRETLTSTRKLLTPFIVGAIGTAIGALVATIVVFRTFGGGDYGGLGHQDAWKLAAALAAKNIGGGLNYVAVASTLGMSSSAFVAGIACDNVFALIYFPLVSFLANKHRGAESAAGEASTSESAAFGDAPKPTRVGDILGAAFAACAMLALGQAIAPNAALPTTTALTVLFATCAPKSLTKPLSTTGQILGDALLFVFFVIAGASGASLASLNPSVLGFLAILYAVHLTIILVSSATVFSKDDPRVAVLASNACVGGPATAAALASAARWPDLLVPGILIGQFGNAIATFIGLALAASFRRVL